MEIRGRQRQRHHWARRTAPTIVLLLCAVSGCAQMQGGTNAPGTAASAPAQGGGAAESGAAPAAQPAPSVSITSVAQLPQPLPYPYDEQADAKSVVTKARKQARHQHKILLIDLGGNWCGDCRVLAAIMDLPDLKPFLDQHFVVAKVNIGRYDTNGDIAARYGIAGRLRGVPAVLVVDPVHDTLINGDRLFALTDARHMTPQGLADWFAQWAQPPGG